MSALKMVAVQVFLSASVLTRSQLMVTATNRSCFQVGSRSSVFRGSAKQGKLDKYNTLTVQPPGTPSDVTMPVGHDTAPALRDSAECLL